MRGHLEVCYSGHLCAVLFFPFLGFIPLGFPSQCFNVTVLCTSNTSSMILKNVVLFFPSLWFFPIGFFLNKVFNKATVFEW